MGLLAVKWVEQPVVKVAGATQEPNVALECVVVDTVPVVQPVRLEVQSVDKAAGVIKVLSVVLGYAHPMMILFVVIHLLSLCQSRHPHLIHP